MNPVEAVSSVFRNYVNFSGRARRSEFWWFILFSFISQSILGWIPIIGQIYGLALLLPALAVMVRRLHDTNRAAWWLLLQIIPPLVWIVLAVLWVLGLAITFDHPNGPNFFDGYLVFLTPAFLIWTLATIALSILMLVILALPGTSGPNQYGPDPLQSLPGAGPGNADALPETGPGVVQYCSRCGAEVQPDAQFCFACGMNI